MEFLSCMESLDIKFVTGIPDSLLKDVCACISEHLPANRHIIATNEGSATALAIGHYLASGKPALVYMQNSGLGNVINPLTSLADSQVYAVPMVLMVGWRGEIRLDGQQAHDEPQHIQQGKITEAQLKILNIPYRVIDGSMKIIEPTMREMVKKATMESRPVALLIRSGTFMPFKTGNTEEMGTGLTREAAIHAVVKGLPEQVCIVSTTGMASRELFEMRKADDTGHHRDFLTVGGMGHANQIAAGIAYTRPEQQVVCLDGDGAILMHMGGMAVSADCPNLLHVVINNACHDSVGGQPTKGAVVDFCKIAAACGYTQVACAQTIEGIKNSVSTMMAKRGSSFLEIKCKKGARKNLGRPDRKPSQNKKEFMEFLQETNG